MPVHFATSLPSGVAHARRLRAVTHLHMCSCRGSVIVDGAEAHPTSSAVISLHKRATIFVHVDIDLMGLHLLRALALNRTLSICLQRLNRSLLLLGEDVRFCGDFDRCNVLVDLV